MSVYLYDEALIKKLQNWTKNTQIHIYGPDETRQMFEVIGDEKGDKPIQLPIISIRRPAGFSILNPNKKPTTYDGLKIRTSDNDEKMLKLSYIPIELTYQLDIYCRYRREADMLARSLIFNIINHPTLNIIIPYSDANFDHNANMKISSDVEDNSDVPERFVPGQFTRLTLNIGIDDARLWDARYRENLSLELSDVQVSEEINFS
jgi:hypothetical protein